MNIKTFEKSYLEVTLPISSEMLEAIENSEYSYALDDYHLEKNNSAYANVFCELTVSFDLIRNETYFELKTVCNYKDCTYGTTDSSGTFVELDPKTAEYFRAEAMRTILQNFNSMAQCRHKPTFATVSA